MQGLTQQKKMGLPAHAQKPIERTTHPAEVLNIIRGQIKKQAAQNIKTRAITHYGAGHAVAFPEEDDEKYLISRKKLPAEKLNIPAQIIVYGDKVAITNFKESLITVLVESKY